MDGKVKSAQVSQVDTPKTRLGLESRSSDSTIFPNSETLSTAFKGYSGILQTEASATTDSELYLIQTLTTGCVYNYDTLKEDLVKKLQDYSVSAFNAIESDQYPPADTELLKINIGKLNTEEKRALGLRVLNNDYDRYLDVYRQRLKLNAYELFLYRISDRLTEGNDEGKDSRIKNLTLDLFGEVPVQKSKVKISDARKATIASTKELLDMVKESPELLSLLTNNCSRLNIDIYHKSKVSAENVSKVLEFLEKEGLERFRSCVQYVQYLKMIELFHRDPSKTNSAPNSTNPTLVVTYLDELTRTFDELPHERFFSPKHGKQLEVTLIDLLRETLNDFDKAYDAEVREIDAIRTTSLSSTAQAVNGKASLQAPLGVNRLETLGPLEPLPLPSETNNIPDFSTFTPENTQSIFAAGRNGSHKNGKPVTPAQTNFNNRRLLIAGLGTAGGITLLGLGAWALGLVGGNKPEENTAPVTSNGNGGATKVNPGTETKTISETDKKKAELVAEIVKLKAEFSTYTDAEDKDQVIKVYRDHGMNVTMAPEAELKKLTTEALSDIYVESLDASCRVVAKGELEELKKQISKLGVINNDNVLNYSDILLNYIKFIPDNYKNEEWFKTETVEYFSPIKFFGDLNQPKSTDSVFLYFSTGQSSENGIFKLAPSYYQKSVQERILQTANYIINQLSKKAYNNQPEINPLNKKEDISNRSFALVRMKFVANLIVKKTDELKQKTIGQ